MKKYRCSYSFVLGKYSYCIDVIADNKGQSREMASACVREKSTFGNNVDPERWNVSEVDTGYTALAKVGGYYKQ